MKYLSKVLYILIFLVMVTSPYAGHTYAEYAREASGSDEARTSSFGITLTTNENAFSVNYGSPEITAESSDGEKIVAPGTAGIFCEYSATGSAEVRTRVTKDAEVILNDYWTTDLEDTGDFYCPLVFTFKSKGATRATVNGLDYTSRGALESALEEILESGNGEYDTSYDFENGTDNWRNNCTVTWRWPFENASGTAITQTMERDNNLGNKETLPTIDVNFKITIEQVD